VNDPKTGHVRGSQLFLLIVHQVTVQHLQYHTRLSFSNEQTNIIKMAV